MSSPLEILDQQDAERAEELKKKPAYKYGLVIAEPQKRLWVCVMDKGVVLDTLYTDTWGGNRMKGTREKTIENAKLIVKALNTFDASVDAPYCHDLEQRIELLEMQLEEAQTKAATYGRLMSGGNKTLKEWANMFGMVVAVDQNGEASCFGHIPVMYLDDDEGIWINSPEHYGEETYLLPPHLIDFDGDWKNSLTLPDGGEEK